MLPENTAEPPVRTLKVAPVSTSLAMRNARFADAAGYPIWLTRTNAVALTALAGAVANVAPASSATDARTTTDRTRTVLPDAMGGSFRSAAEHSAGGCER